MEYKNKGPFNYGRSCLRGMLCKFKKQQSIQVPYNKYNDCRDDAEIVSYVEKFYHSADKNLHNSVDQRLREQHKLSRAKHIFKAFPYLDINQNNSYGGRGSFSKMVFMIGIRSRCGWIVEQRRIRNGATYFRVACHKWKYHANNVQTASRAILNRMSCILTAY